VSLSFSGPCLILRLSKPQKMKLYYQPRDYGGMYISIDCSFE
jgi:hypothetical protein